MLLQLPDYCPLEQLSQSKHALCMVDGDFPWSIVYNNVEQILAEHSSQAPLTDFHSLLGTEWLKDSVIAALIDCMKRGIPKPDSAAAMTMEPPSALRGSAAGKHARSINLDEVCIVDPAMSRKILMAFRTRDYGDVLRVFSHSCKFKTVKRILMPLNVSWEGITLGTGDHWMFAELHLDTGTTHLYDWFKKQHDQYEKIAGVATCYTAIMCTDAYVCPRHTVTHSRCTPPAAPLQDLLVVLRQRCVGLCLSPTIDNTKRMVSVHNAKAQQNGYDCGVWTCYTMYHRALQQSTTQDPADIFTDMNMKTPQDAKCFRSSNANLLLSVALSPATSLRAHVPPVLSTVTLSGIHTSVFKCRLWMLISLPAYKHDYPKCVVWSDRNTRLSANKVHSDQVTVEPQVYTAEAWHASVRRDQPALFKIPDFSPDVMKSGLRDFAQSDTHQFCTSGGGAVQMRSVFNDENKQNVKRIEDGIYPEKVPPALPATNILQQACPPNCTVMDTWLAIKAYIDTHFPPEQHDPETRAMTIVTGNVTGVVGSHKCYGVDVDKNGMRVGCHFDAFASAGFLLAGSKDFRVCEPCTFGPNSSLNPHANERYDIDAAFCEKGVWYNIHLKPGYVMYLPMHWWHQVSHTAPLFFCPAPSQHLGKPANGSRICV